MKFSLWCQIIVISYRHLTWNFSWKCAMLSKRAWTILWLWHDFGWYLVLSEVISFCFDMQNLKGFPFLRRNCKFIRWKCSVGWALSVWFLLLALSGWCSFYVHYYFMYGLASLRLLSFQVLPLPTSFASSLALFILLPSVFIGSYPLFVVTITNFTLFEC